MAFIVAFGALSPAVAADYPPQDHNGADWVLADGDRVWGLHVNVGNFEIPSTVTVTVAPYHPGRAQTGTFSVEAERIRIDGILSADGVGYTGGGGGGGRPEGSGYVGAGCMLSGWPCSGYPSFEEGSYGVGRYPGFMGASPGDGPFGGFETLDGGYLKREENGDTSTDSSISMGSGGGGGYGAEGTRFTGGGGGGGAGGGAISLKAAQSILISRPVSARGTTGQEGGVAIRKTPDCNTCQLITIVPTNYRLCLCSTVAFLGGDGGNSEPPGTGFGNDGAFDGGAGAGGGILLSCGGPGGIRISGQGTLDALGGRSQTTNGGTVKVFCNGGFVREGDIQAGRVFAHQLSGEEAFPLRFEFNGTHEGWRPVWADSFTSPSFVAPSAQTGLLGLTAHNNRSTFGYFESPPIVSADSETPGGLVVADFQVATTETKPEQVPQLRLRATTVDLCRSAALMIESQGLAEASPTPQGRRYLLPFQLPSPTSSLPYRSYTLSFELLNFDPNDDPTGDLLLNSAEVAYHFLDEASIPWRLDREYTFTASSHDEWESNTAAPFTAPVFSRTADALAIRGVADRLDVFGFWSSPENEVLVEPDRLYRATFRVESDIAASYRYRTPQFRLRINASNLQASSFVAVESHGRKADSPTVGEPRDYAVYFLPPPSAAGHGLVFSFDFLNFDPEDQDDATLYLHGVKVESIDAATVLAPASP